jgi:hypothetical protein
MIRFVCAKMTGRRYIMVKVALFVRLEAKPGKEKEVESFLLNGLPLVQEEPATTPWHPDRHQLLAHSSGVTGRYGRIHERRTMDPAYLSALAALAGSATGGLTSLVASLLMQRAQFDAQQLVTYTGRRGELYKEFIEEASKTFADAIEHDTMDVSKLVHLYALVSRMRVLSSPKVIDEADRVIRRITETYLGKNKSLRDLVVAHDQNTDILDPLRNFSNACHDELRSSGGGRTKKSI